MSTKKPRIFVSHAWEDNALVSRLENELKLAGAELWVDLSDVRAGDIITSRVNKALGWCDTLVLVWSHAASHSKWVEQEWGAAFNAKKRIVPCKTDDELLPILLTNIGITFFWPVSNSALIEISISLITQSDETEFSDKITPT